MIGANLGLAMTTRWSVELGARHAWRPVESTRAQLVVKRSFAVTGGTVYLGAGPSITNELGERLAHGRWGAVALVGAKSALAAWRTQPIFFAEAQLFTHHYGCVQLLVGLRLQRAHAAT
jgi:hypothetical protein